MRSIDSATLEALQQPVKDVLYFVRFHLDSGVRAWNSGFNDIAFDGYEYQGLGPIGSISEVEEKAEVSATNITVAVSGVDDSMLALFINEPVQGRDAYVHVAIAEPGGGAIKSGTTPILHFRGTLDAPKGECGKVGSINIDIISRLADWQRKRIARYNHADQQLRYSSDMGMEFVEQMVNREISWGR